MRGGYGVQRIPRRIPRNVELIDHVPAEAMDELVWSRTAILLAPSARESWGMTATEALQRGIPVVAHPTPGLLESLDVAGVFIDRARTREWVRVIRRLQEPEVYARRSRIAAARGVELLAISRRQATEFVRLIEGLVAHV